MNWLDAMSEAVAKGLTQSQFAIPDGTFEGDLFFITDSKNKIIHAFAWHNKAWYPECTVFTIQDEQGTPLPLPK